MLPHFLFVAKAVSLCLMWSIMDFKFSFSLFFCNSFLAFFLSVLQCSKFSPLKDCQSMSGMIFSNFSMCHWRLGCCGFSLASLCSCLIFHSNLKILLEMVS